MDDKTVEKNGEISIDLQRVFAALLQNIWSIVLVTVLGAVLSFLVTYYLITPQYQASAKFYVNNSSLSIGNTSVSMTSGDLVTSRNLVNSYIVILNTRESLNDVIDYSGVNRTYGQLRGMIKAQSVNETEIFEVVVTSPDPNEAEKIANAIAYILPKRIATIIDGTSAKVVDAAIVPSSPSSPSYSVNTMIGLMIGLVLSVGVVILHELFDVTIRTEEDVTSVCAHPILAAVPDMEAVSKGGYYYGYGNNKKKKQDKSKNSSQTKQPPNLIGGNISFAASEAYKLLRTKLQFSFADDNDCRVIGVSSALTGEGKSLSSVNLAYTLSQLDKKVLLIDCDMRRPSLNAKLPIQKMPGLSNYLAGQSHMDTLVQLCGLPGEEDAFHVVSSGRNPPNPVELLSSARMTRMLQRLREVYDYIILDLPPVSEVSDALAVAKNTDGMLMVVRQNFCNRIALKDVVNQFEFVDSKMLGIIYNCASDNGVGYGGRYYNKKYYKRYYNRYHRRYYEGSYHSAAKQIKKTAGEATDAQASAQKNEENK